MLMVAAVEVVVGFKVTEVVVAAVDSRDKVKGKVVEGVDPSRVVEVVVPLAEVPHLPRANKLTNNSNTRTKNTHFGVQLQPSGPWPNCVRTSAYIYNSSSSSKLLPLFRSILFVFTLFMTPSEEPTIQRP